MAVGSQADLREAGQAQADEVGGSDREAEAAAHAGVAPLFRLHAGDARGDLRVIGRQHQSILARLEHGGHEPPAIGAGDVQAPDADRVSEVLRPANGGEGGEGGHLLRCGAVGLHEALVGAQAGADGQPAVARVVDGQQGEHRQRILLAQGKGDAQPAGAATRAAGGLHQAVAVVDDRRGAVAFASLLRKGLGGDPVIRLRR